MQGYWFNPSLNIEGIKPTTGKYGMAQRCYVAKFGVGTSSRLLQPYIGGANPEYGIFTDIPYFDKWIGLDGELIDGETNMQFYMDTATVEIRPNETLDSLIERTQKILPFLGSTGGVGGGGVVLSKFNSHYQSTIGGYPVYVRDGRRELVSMLYRTVEHHTPTDSTSGYFKFYIDWSKKYPENIWAMETVKYRSTSIIYYHPTTTGKYFSMVRLTII